MIFVVFYKFYYGVFMAVQKNKSTRSKRGMRRSHDFLKRPEILYNSTSKEVHFLYHISKFGYYKGKKIF